MISIKVTENLRLDQVVYRELKSLENFEEILKLNKHLINKPILDIGDIVYLLELKQEDNTIIKEKALW